MQYDPCPEMLMTFPSIVLRNPAPESVSVVVPAALNDDVKVMAALVVMSVPVAPLLALLQPPPLLSDPVDCTSQTVSDGIAILLLDLHFNLSNQPCDLLGQWLTAMLVASLGCLDCNQGAPLPHRLHFATTHPSVPGCHNLQRLDQSDLLFVVADHFANVIRECAD